MELRVNDYVRTKDYGFIKAKSFYYNEDMIHILDENCNEYDFSKELVDDFKSSPNIIDLIEVGDYVNGKEVKHIADFEGIDNPITKLIFVDETHLVPGETVENEDIKSIVTKEQFSSMEYKVN